MKQLFTMVLRGIIPRQVMTSGWLLVLAPGLAAQAQAPAVTTLSPSRNAIAVAGNSSVVVGFSQNMNNATASNIKVFSARAGGKKAGAYSTSGGTVTFAPTTGFKPGETVFATIPTTVQSTGGLANTTKQVYQFTTAAGGTGKGIFTSGSDVALGSSSSVTTGDVNGDGFLDVVTAGSSTVNVQLNSGTGTFSSGSSYTVGNCYFPQELALGDLDGDGDLDFVVVNEGTSSVTIRLNSGTGTFSGSGNISVGNAPYCVAIGDIDGDGDLDLLTGDTGGLSISIRFNDGTGTFSGTTSVPVSPQRLAGLALGDLDGDGDLDLAGASYAGAILICLNDGTGTFSGSTNLAVPQAYGVALGDLDGDGDLDVVAGSGGASNGLIYIRLNDGHANFTSAPDLTAGSQPCGVTLGDVDADGDLDVVAANRASSVPNLFLNSGTGSFGSASTITAAYTVLSTALGDLDGDGDLDFVTGGGGMSVRLNQPPMTTLTSFTPTRGPVGTAVTVTGTYLTGTTVVTLNGTAGAITANSATSLTFTVAAGSTSGAITLTAPVGTATSQVNPVLRLQATGGTGGDKSIYLDQVEILQGGAVVVGAVGNPSFETGPTGSYTNSPTTATPWTFAGNGGNAAISTTASSFSPPAPPDGSAHLVVFQGGTPYIEQPLTLAAGTYQVRMQLAQRQCCSSPSDQGVNVLINGVVVGTTLTNTGASYVSMVSAPFSVSSAGVFTVVAPPTLTAVAPNPGGLGQTIALTGTNLSNPTALTVNGANALGNIISNTGTGLVVRVPATATASGTVSLTTVAGTATSAFTVMAPPGNALAFDGNTNNLHNAGVLPNTGEFTIEAWLNPTVVNGNFAGLVLSDDFNSGAMHCQFDAGNNLKFGINGNSPAGFSSTLTLPTGQWSHVAVVYSASAKTVAFYLNGVLHDSFGFTTALAVGAQSYSVGGWLSGGSPQRVFNGRLDEVRLYTTALTPAQVQADMLSTASAVPASLNLYLNFDQGTPATASTGANTGLTTLYDLASAAPFTLTNFNLTSGNTTSNYVESYALAVPPATAATAQTSTGFTANWTAPALGTATSYLVDVSTGSTFASVVSGSPFTVAGGTRALAVTGLTSGTTYYYRIRADKTSVTGQGAASNVITVCPLPVAIAQNVGVTLDVNGNATVAATAVNNGSTANCGLATAGTLSVSPSSFSCVDAVPPTVASAVIFNGTSQYVEGTNALLPVGNAARTLEAWVYPTAASANGIIFNYGTPTTNLRSGILLSNGVLYYVGENNDLRGSLALTVNAWNHVAATYDGSTLKLYVNGVLDAQATPSAFNTTGTIWRIAQRSYPGTGEFLAGQVDEVRVWRIARTAVQLAASKGIGLPGGSAGLVAYYRLNEGNGSTTADATASNGTGTLYNSPTWTTGAAPVTNGSPVTLTVTDASGNTSTAPAIATVSVPATPTTAWNGNLSSSPLACQNWSYGQMPDAATNAVIPTGRPLYPTVSSGTVATKDLTVDAGGSLTVASGATLQVNGDLANNGTATLSGPVQFVGSAGTQALGGSTSTPFTALVVNKPSGTVQLGQTLAISQALTLTSGTLTTGTNYQVTLGSSASLSETDASFVVGNVVANRTLAPGTVETFSGLGLTLTPAAGSTAPGVTQVTRRTGTALTGTGTSQGILRNYTIVPAVNTGLNVTMNFAYLTHELNGIPTANLVLFKSGSGTTPWMPQRGTTAGTNVLTKTGITDFSVWTLGNAANPLPVELTSFTATAEGPTAVRLAWATASEQNSAAFEIERSVSGTNFERLGTVAAAGSSSATHTYELWDAKLPSSTVLLYYRLKQVDQAGTFSYSPVRTVALAGATAGLALYPNPTTTEATLAGALPGTLVTVHDVLGRLVATASANAAGLAALPLPAGLPAGVYMVRAGPQVLRLTVK